MMSLYWNALLATFSSLFKMPHALPQLELTPSGPLPREGEPSGLFRLKERGREDSGKRSAQIYHRDNRFLIYHLCSIIEIRSYTRKKKLPDFGCAVK
jgi:hypothetical protein